MLPSAVNYGVRRIGRVARGDREAGVVARVTADVGSYVGGNGGLVRELAMETLRVGEKGTPDRSLTIVSAEPGSGKTRFVQEVYEELVRGQPSDRRF
jgi:hypothetical protein